MPSYRKGSFAQDCKDALRALPLELQVFTELRGEAMMSEIKRRTPVDVERTEAIAAYLKKIRKTRRPEEFWRKTSKLRHWPGELRESIKISQLHTYNEGEQTNYEIRVYSPLEWASFVEYPTDPHLIHARYKPRLVFFWEKKGYWYFDKSVHHPGTEGAHMFSGGAWAIDNTLETHSEHLLQNWTSAYFKSKYRMYTLKQFESRQRSGAARYMVFSRQSQVRYGQSAAQGTYATLEEAQARVAHLHKWVSGSEAMVGVEHSTIEPRRGR